MGLRMEASPACEVGRKALDACRRFPQHSDRGIAAYLTKRHPELFRSFDNAREVVRRLRGHAGEGGKHRIKRRHHLLPPEVKMPPPLHKVREDFKLPKGTWGILSDVHIPFHEPKPIDAALKLFAREKITGLILNGDFMDCAACSYWSATDRRDFMREVEQACDFLDLLKKAFPKAKIVMRQGNHEERLTNYFNAHAPELIDMPTADMATVLSCENRGIDFLDRKQKIVASELTILHGHEMTGSSTIVSPARWAMLRGKACCAVGHWHMTSEQTEQDINRKMITCWSVGCLCDLEPDYSAVGNRWNWGCAIVRYDGSNYWEFENRRILNTGKMV